MLQRGDFHIASFRVVNFLFLRPLHGLALRPFGCICLRLPATGVFRGTGTRRDAFWRVTAGYGGPLTTAVISHQPFVDQMSWRKKIRAL